GEEVIDDLVGRLGQRMTWGQGRGSQAEDVDAFRLSRGQLSGKEDADVDGLVVWAEDVDGLVAWQRNDAKTKDVEGLVVDDIMRGKDDMEGIRLRQLEASLRPQSSDSGRSGQCAWIFRTTSSGGNSTSQVRWLDSPQILLHEEVEEEEDDTCGPIFANKSPPALA
ncbi:hypothetical protein THAOC_07965, partial [Thalassiosira oceanica]